MSAEYIYAEQVLYCSALLLIALIGEYRSNKKKKKMASFKRDSEQGFYDSRQSAKRDKEFLKKNNIKSPDTSQMIKIECASKGHVFANVNKLKNPKEFVDKTEEKYGKISRIIKPTGEIIEFGDEKYPKDLFEGSDNPITSD